MMLRKNKALIIDALSLIHRAYHAYPPFTDADGRPIGAVYGVTRIFLSVVNQLQPKLVVAAFDTKAPTFRHKQYADYKAKRPPTDEAMLIQIPQIEDLLAAAGVVILKQDGFEADDMIGSLVNKTDLKNKDLVDQFIILSGDWDLAQLIKNNDIIFQYTRGSSKQTEIVNQQLFTSTWGFKPQLLPDYKALAGDASDNIPGIKGIGKKTAQVLVSRFGNIDTIYQILSQQPEAISQITSKRVISLLEQGKKQAYFSKELATIKTDIKLSLTDLSHCQFKCFNHDFVELLHQYHFKSLIKMVNLTSDKDSSLPRPEEKPKKDDKQQLNLFG